jgi:carbon-monoxide dehydrogenase large subunit
MGIPQNKLRIIAPAIGGGFGTKGYVYPDMPLILFLAKLVGRPIKWVETRTGQSQSTVHGRDNIDYATLAGTKDGKITGLYSTSYANLGAYASTIGPGVSTAMFGRSISGTYDIPNVYSEVYVAFTNTSPIGAYRGSGRTEATFVIERLIDQFARKIGMDPAEVRRRNYIQPNQFPFDNRLGWTYDSGNYQPTLDRALEMIGYSNIPAKKAEARQRGKRLGLGIASHVAACGVGPSPTMGREGMNSGTWESANIKIFPTSEISLTITTQPHGQSHETTFSQVLAQELEVPLDTIKVYHSDTQGAQFGFGSYGSRSFAVAAPVIQRTAQKLKAKLIKQAAFMLEANEADIVYEEGKMYVKGAPERVKYFQEVVWNIWYAWNIPPDMEPNLDETTFLDPKNFVFPFGTHVVLVEVDEQTGKVDIVRYVAVNDMGNVANPMVVDGQAMGGITQGIGQALYESCIYDEKGYLATTNFETYPIPRANWLPNYELDRTVTPTPVNELGAKAAGEIGIISPTACIGNAIVDALSDLGVNHIDMPFTPEKVWRAMQTASSSSNNSSQSQGKGVE